MNWVQCTSAARETVWLNVERLTQMVRRQQFTYVYDGSGTAVAVVETPEQILELAAGRSEPEPSDDSEPEASAPSETSRPARSRRPSRSG